MRHSGWTVNTQWDTHGGYGFADAHDSSASFGRPGCSRAPPSPTTSGTHEQVDDDVLVAALLALALATSGLLRWLRVPVPLGAQ
jgi:hypothetical protein